MSLPVAPDPAKLVIGIFTADRSLLDGVAQRLCESYGPLDIVSPWLAFDRTDYYAPEMGSNLERRIMAFKPLIDPGTLAAVKTATNAIEADLACDGRRRINIDPGILTRERFVLATGKNYAHRIYLVDGIYADLTLVYRDGCFQPLPWTYPDYAGDPIRSLLAVIREKYLRDLRTGASTLKEIS
jgi:hypothetical protein